MRRRGVARLDRLYSASGSGSVGSGSGRPMRSAAPSKASASGPGSSTGHVGAVASPARNESRNAASISGISSLADPVRSGRGGVRLVVLDRHCPRAGRRGRVRPAFDAAAASPFVERSASGQAPTSRRTGSNAGLFGNGAWRISAPRFGAQVRQRPSAVFQQLPQVYWRQFMQKLNVEWNASSCWAVAARSSSPRAAAIASSSDESSLMTQFFTPFESVLNWPRLPGLARRDRLERVARAAALAEGLGEDLGHAAPGYAVPPTAGFPTGTGREYSAGVRGSLHRSYGRRRDDGPDAAGRMSGRSAARLSRPDPCTVAARRRVRRAARNSQGRLLDSAPDMGPLAAVERFLERLFEGQSARLFHTGLRPIQVQRRLERAMESQRIREANRTIVPHRLVVRLSPPDLTSLRAASPTLAADLADAALAFARAHAYTLLDRPTVTLRGDSDVAPGSRRGRRAGRSAATAAASAARQPPVTRTRSITRPPGGRLVRATGAGRRSRPGPRGDGRLRRPRGRRPAGDDPRDPARPLEPDVRLRGPPVDDRPGRRTTGSSSGTVGRRDITPGSTCAEDRSSSPISAARTARGSTTGGSNSIALGEGDQVRIGLTTLIIEAVEPMARPARPHPAEADGGGLGTEGAGEAGAGSTSDRPALA